MNTKRVALSLIVLFIAFSIGFANAETLCGRVLTDQGSPAHGAVITLSNRIANANQKGEFCFKGVSAGKYSVTVRWKDDIFTCHVQTSASNRCSPS